VAGLLQACTRREGRVAIVVTHDPRLVPYADRVLVMEDGVLEARPGGVRRAPSVFMDHVDQRAMVKDVFWEAQYALRS
jgi:ABC-type lipoprotein export system ATPase subunit